MAIADPTWMQNLSFSAKEDREVITAMYDEGVLTPTSAKVTQQVVPAYSVLVAAGRLVVTGDDQTLQGNYLVRLPIAETVPWPAPPGSNSRIDLLVARINDPNAGGPAGNNCTLTVVQGVAAASPVAPAVPTSALVLAQLLIPAGKATILAADITDRRVIAGQRCEVGVCKLFTGATPPSGYVWGRGGTVLRADYPELNELYSAQGYPFGAGNGTTTFGLPDMGGREVIAVGTGFATAGASGGASTVTLSAANMPAHTHPSPTHVHTGPSHVHDMSHGHTAGSGTQSANHVHNVAGVVGGADGAHEHFADGVDGSYMIAVTSGGSSAFTGPGVNIQYITTTRYDGVHGHSINVNSGAESANHTHAITVNAIAANTGAGGTGSTSGYIGDATTGSTGSGTAVNNMDPYIVIQGWIIRAAG